MQERTRSYLRGRFGDYYRRSDISLPSAAERREWGYIPWQAGRKSMIRHQSLLEMGDLGDFLARERPRHVYYSAGHYRTPSAGTMAEKDRFGTDLIFDLDADHLPDVDADADSYGEMLESCKAELLDLLSILETDFGFEDMAVVFSGGRGYHVHVRDADVLELGRSGRREVVNYVRGEGIEFEDLLRTEPVVGIGLQNPAEKRSLDTSGGWGRRVHQHVIRFVEELSEMSEQDALTRLQKFDGIGEGKATAIRNAIDTNFEEIESGNIDVHPAFVSLARKLLERTIERESAAIDEPVTTDVNRLIRLPGSLHGGTGLRVMPISEDDLEEFNPLEDAVADPFLDHEIRISTNTAESIELGGETFRVPAGVTTVPEYVAIFLMARGRAEKEKE